MMKYAMVSMKGTIKGRRYSYHRYGGKFRWLAGRLSLGYGVGNISEEAQTLDVTKKALYVE